MDGALVADGAPVVAAESGRDDNDARAPGFPIVGIGASAGGLEAFTQLLRELPGDTGMAFVMVQHLAPKYESMLTELLANQTSLPVAQVREGMRVERNRVYVIPPNSSMGIRDGVLHLVPRTEASGQHMPIDIFLRSLAEDQRGQAIGVILSGTASDGAMGLKAIKAEGGITLAQEPASARYDGMPRAAITAGVVDFVLPIERIAQELVKIGRHPYLAPNVKADALEETPDTDGNLQRIFVLLRSATGSDFTHYKHATIRRRIRRRMVLHKIERLGDYVRLLQQNPVEVENLYQDILIHVTGFFRDPEMFDALKTEVFEKIVADRQKGTPIRVWVPGCSTGEEVYSLAIALLEVADVESSLPIHIFATDISQAAVDKARAGFYSEATVSEVSPERLRRFFVKADGGYRISKMIRDMCIFARQDVTKDPPFSKLDIISCRNLLIYLGPVLQRRVLSVFHYALKPGGYLVLGASETIGSFADLFAPADKRHKFYLRKPSHTHLQFEFEPEHAIEPGARSREVIAPRPDLHHEIDRAILGRLAPAAVVVSTDLQVLHVRGNTGKYLQPAPGAASMHVLKMARDGLAHDLRNAIHLARKRGGPVRKQGIRVRQNGHTGEVDVEVTPIELVNGETNFLVLFHDSDPDRSPGETRREDRPPRKRVPPRARSARGPRAELQRLEDELDTTRDYLQSIIQDQEAINEELQSANEEILSSNEELQSTNEELETAKEELQSTNEELNTVNEELQTRNSEMSHINSDLTNLLASVQIPIIMVSNDLRLRRFTPMAERVLNLLPSDVGRPIGDFKPNLRITNLEPLLAETIETVTVKELEIQDLDGRWYSMRLRPYKSIENRIDGAVVTLVDIHAMKVNMAEHAAADQIVTSVVDIIRRPLVVLSVNGQVRKASRAFYRLFRVSPQEAEGREIYELNERSWDVPRMRGLLEDFMRRQDRVEDYEIVLDHPQIGRKTWIIDAVAVGGRTEDFRLVLLACRAGDEPAGDRD
jgi:two-component system CheB/CheR fusion protein